MDGKKDEALKCLKIAQNAIESGDRTRALKFVNKARGLDPSLSVDELLSKVEAQSQSNAPTNEIPSKISDDGPRRRVSTTGSSASASSTASVSYTEEQISIVREIERKKIITRY
ncbi:unnamed protein product [Ilex paraguariensis]|uniref:Uncharacterized protein n=1 Tax=Ilex paraguariensis TaxID=185542 RepID=A0ABC8RW01_9AQUA